VYNDGVSTGPIQPGYSTNFTGFRNTSFTYQSAGSSGTATLEEDSDGHEVQFNTDSIGRIQQSIATVGNTQLSTLYTWNSSNELTSIVDPRGAASGATPQQYESDFAWDNAYHLIASALPPVNGSRPTTYSTYDQYGNLVAGCDANWSARHGDNWTATPAPNSQVCPTSQDGQHSVFQYTAQSYAPYGELTQVSGPGANNSSTPYNATIQYSASLQAGTDYGQPTNVAGDTITTSKGSYAATVAMSYDADGRRTCLSVAGQQTSSNTGNGSVVTSYDSDNRVTQTSDPDDSSVAGCGKSLQGSLTLVSSTSYYPDGSVKSTQTPSEAAYGVSTQYSYDADGNLTATNDHHGCTTSGCAGGTTLRFYDGDDRIIEIVAASDSSDEFSPAPWAERFLYDLSENGITGSGAAVTSPSGQRQSLNAHGNLFSVQLYLPPATNAKATGWQDFQGTAYDAIDREIQSYRVSPGGTSWSSATYNFDGSPSTLGFLSSEQYADGTLSQFAYNAPGGLSSVMYSNAPSGSNTGARSFSYDANGELTSETFGTLSQSLGYDYAGNLTSETEPSGGGITSPATYQVTYNPDGTRSGLSVSSSALSGQLYSYYYNSLGEPSEIDANLPNGTTMTATYAYSIGGRLISYGVPGAQSGCCAIGYSKYGNIASEQVPIGSARASTGFLKYSQFDAEGAPTTYTGYGLGVNNANVTVSKSYNDRGELITESASPTTTAIPPQRYHGFAGVMIPDPSNASGYAPSSETFDYLNGTHLTAHYNDLNDEPTDDTWSYDALGRQSEKFRNISSSLETIEKTTTFDSEDQLVSSVETTQLENKPFLQSNLTYSWSPSGHVALAAGDISRSSVSGYSPTSSESLHWFGSELVFTTNRNGTLDDFKVGNLADFTTLKNPTYNGGSSSSSPGLNVWGRDSSGVQATSVGTVNANFLPPSDPTIGYGLADPDTAGIMPIQEPRADGYTDLHSEFQGGRIYDYAGNQWLSADLKPLAPLDLGSLRPYAFLGNTGSGLDGTGQDGSCNASLCNGPGSGSGGSINVQPAINAIGAAVGALIKGIEKLFGDFFGFFHHNDSHAQPPPLNVADPAAYAIFSEDEAFVGGIENLYGIGAEFAVPEAAPLKTIATYIVAARGSRVVYVLIDSKGIVCRCGRTFRNYARMMEHRKTFPSLKYVPVFDNLHYGQMRGLAQRLYETYGAPLDERAEIGPRAFDRITSPIAANDYLRDNGVEDFKGFVDAQIDRYLNGEPLIYFDNP
jgi:YD repeat-containing protein